MKLLRFIIVLLFGLETSIVWAQKSIVVSGGEAGGSGGVASYSVGQICFSTINDSKNSLNQGVQQPYEFSPVGINENKMVSSLSVIYPNPTKAEINLTISNLNSNNLYLNLNDINGKTLLTQNIYSENTFIPVSDISSGTYFLLIIDKNTVIKTFKVIKL